MLLHEKQKEVAASNARFKVIRAGRRSGKSSVEVEAMLFKAVNGKNRSVFYIAPTQIQARSIIWEALKSRIGGLGEAHEQRLEMKVPTVDGGFSFVKIGGWENRENFRGLSADHITFDELDTMRDFFVGWQEIFRPALLDRKGTADFIGTPKKENPNLRRLEKEAEGDPAWECFRFSTEDNPHIPREEIAKAKQEMDPQTYKQEILAEYVENQGALFKFGAIVDVFTNTVSKDGNKYLIVDVSEDGTDATKFSFWEGLEEYRRETFRHLTTEAIIAQIREYQSAERIPMSHTLVDAIGPGVGVASSSLLDGIIGYKGSYAPIRTEISPVSLPEVHAKQVPLVSDYRNLRSQCVFTLAEHVNGHKIASRVTGDHKESIIEELPVYQDVSKGDGKRMATPKEDVRELLGHSPDDSDTWIMRMYFVIRDKMLPDTSQEDQQIREAQEEYFSRNTFRQRLNSTK